jgi:hypothetical protein
MKWTPVDSHGLDVVLKPLATSRVFHALEKLQDGGYGLTKASTRQHDHHAPGTYRQSEPLNALFIPSREHIGSWNKAPKRDFWTCQGKYSCFSHFGGLIKWS